MSRRQYTDEERLALASKLDKELDDFIENLPRRAQPTEKITPAENWLEEFDKHPFFMKKLPEANDELHPLYEGLQQLKYDPNENTADELAVAYKEDGNFNFKHKNYRLAVIAYTEGIKAKAEDVIVKATLYNNRAAAHFFLQNFRSALRDCEMALKLKPDYRKARVRAIQCALQVNKFDEGLAHCDVLLPEDPSAEIVDLRQKLKKKQAEWQRDARKREKQRRNAEKNNENLFATLQKRNIHFNSEVSKENLQPVYEELRQFSVYLDESGVLLWPVVLMYPEVAVTEFIQGFSEDSTLSDQLGEVLAVRPPWDTDGKYTLENVNVYFSPDQPAVDLHKSLKDLLSPRAFIVYNGSPTFYVLPRHSSAEQKFRTSSS